MSANSLVNLLGPYTDNLTKNTSLRGIFKTIFIKSITDETCLELLSQKSFGRYSPETHLME